MFTVLMACGFSIFIPSSMAKRRWPEPRCIGGGGDHRLGADDGGHLFRQPVGAADVPGEQAHGDWPRSSLRPPTTAGSRVL